MKKTAITLFTLSLLAVGGTAWAATIDGTSGPDNLVGTASADTISAFGGNDIVKAGGGDDLVLAGAGADILNGQKGSDELRGGPGPDKIDAGADGIRDYAVGGGGGDKIYVRGTDWAFGNGGDDRIWMTYGDTGGKVNCGAGHDVVIFNEPSPEITLLGCEKVKIVSAG